MIESRAQESRMSNGAIRVRAHEANADRILIISNPAGWGGGCSLSGWPPPTRVFCGLPARQAGLQSRYIGLFGSVSGRAVGAYV